MTSRSLQREDYSPFPNNFTPKHLEKDIEDSPFFRRLKETADKEPGVLTVAQRDFVRMWHTQADGVYTLRQDFVQTAFDHIKSQGHAWSLYHDIWNNLGRLLPMADIGRHASRVHTEDGNLHRTTSPHDSKPLTANTVIAVASDPSVSIASEYTDEAATTDSEESVVVDDPSSSSSDEKFRGLFDAHRDPEIDEYNDENATTGEPAATYMYSEEPVVVNEPWAQYDMDEADYYYASIHGLHAAPRETLNVNTFRSEFHSLGHSLYRNPVLRGYGTSNMCYSPKLGDAVPKLGSDVITPAPPPKDVVTPSAPKLGGNPRKVRNYNTYDYNQPDSQ